MKSIAHISDLHFGTEVPLVGERLLEKLNSLKPGVVAVSGDFTQRARTGQFKAAQGYLKRIPFPKIVIPGNHDVPLFNLLRRFLYPFTRYKKFISEDLNPVFRNDGLVVMGLNTARPSTWKEGRISMEQMEKMRATLCAIPEEAFKVVITHHPFIPPPQSEGTKPVGRAAPALDVIADCGVDLLLAGHLHHGYSGEVRPYYPKARRSVVVVQAGTAISRRTRKMPNAFNYLTVSHKKIVIHVHVWRSDSGAFEESFKEIYCKKDTAWVKD